MIDQENRRAWQVLTGLGMMISGVPPVIVVGVASSLEAVTEQEMLVPLWRRIRSPTNVFHRLREKVGRRPRRRV